MPTMMRPGRRWRRTARKTSPTAGPVRAVRVVACGPS
jgi:hypothetical protein